MSNQLEVWYGPMPESNGKSNFTATLMRKGGSLFDSENFTFARSEYPERVRYDADCMRYLIGDIDVEPCSLDYDGDKHSGYAYPKEPEPGWIDAKVRPPEPGHIVKRWKDGSTWSGLFTGDPKMASCDYWFKLPNW